ncbi:MAG: hypothetical protein U1F66_11390 [bacterium]
MAERRPKSARFFHVVGGGCFGSQYVRWLLRARSLGMLEFEKVFAVDRDPACKLSREGPLDPACEIVARDWVEYLTGWLLGEVAGGLSESDYLVPSPLAPHLLLLSLLRAAERKRPGLRFAAEPCTAEVPTPVRIPLASGNLALSFAQWQCPVNCIEPGICPAIHAERSWDMLPTLRGFFSEHPEAGSAHVLQCCHYVHGVGAIPMGEIARAFEVLLADLEKASTERVSVATVSRCHGLVGTARVLRG